MPIQSIIVLAGIVSVFAVFVVTMAWVDYYTRGFHAQEPAE